MNKWFGIGRLTRDVELRYTTEQQSVANFSIAIDRPPKRDGSKVTDFVPVVCFGKLAESCDKYIGKGRLVGIEGQLNIDRYEKDGEIKYSTKIVAQHVEFLEWGEKKEKVSFEELDEDIPF